MMIYYLNPYETVRSLVFHKDEMKTRLIGLDDETTAARRGHKSAF